MLRQVVEGQKLELEQSRRQAFVERRLQTPDLGNPLVKVVMGPRRAGKSLFSQQWAKSAGSFGYLNFDDERLIGLEDYDALTAELNAVYGSPGLLLLDEIQNLDKWELWVNRLQRLGIRLIVTGSNAHLLSSELATHLTGRHERLVLFPFSFAEYKDAVCPGHNLSDLQVAALLPAYLQEGGFPETRLASINQREYLKTLFQATIYKDIVKRHRITAAESIESLGRYLLSNTGSEYSFRSLVQVVGCKSDMTVRKYLRFLEEAFLLFSVPRFSYKVREQASLNKKIYAIDNGLIQAIGFNPSPGTGKLAENAVAIVLEKQRLQGKLNYFFWKNSQQEEVDFVLLGNGKVSQCIQVCWNLDQAKTSQREIRALVKASRELSCPNLQILTETKEAEEQVEWGGVAAKVAYTPLWKWLLKEGESFSISQPA